MFCSVITKNSNWEILTKNIVTFKRQYGVKDEKLFGGFTEKSNFFFWGGGEGIHEKPIWRGDCLKMGLWTVCRFKGVFLRGWGGMGGFILKGVLFGKNDLNIPVFFLKFVTNSFS